MRDRKKMGKMGENGKILESLLGRYRPETLMQARGRDRRKSQV